MLLFESFDKLSVAKERIEKGLSIYIYVDKLNDAKELSKLLYSFGIVHNPIVKDEQMHYISNFFDYEVDYENYLIFNVWKDNYILETHSKTVIEEISINTKYIFNYPNEKSIIIKLFSKDFYKPRKLVYESKDNTYPYREIVVKVNSLDEYKRLIKYLNRTLNINKNPDDDRFSTMVEYPNFVFIPTDIKDYPIQSITFLDEESPNVTQISKYIYNNDDTDGTYLTMNDLSLIKNILLRGTKSPTYKPRKLAYESNQSKILYAFDMDDTLVYSKRFEEHLKPLINEYLTPENILMNKLEDIDVNIEDLKYENDRIYFDDPNHKIKIPDNSSWVRKKDRVYITQPDAYFMTSYSMPIGKYDKIVNIYNSVENNTIITARSNRLKRQTIKSLNELGLEQPKYGLHMYPDNSYSYKEEFKTNKILELCNKYGFEEVHYFDDNIKLLKKMKKILNNSDIKISFYKVTKNNFRKI